MVIMMPKNKNKENNPFFMPINPELTEKAKQIVIKVPATPNYSTPIPPPPAHTPTIKKNEPSV